MSTADKNSKAAPIIENNSHAVIPDHVVESLARCLLPKLRAFYDSEDGQHAFAEWKVQQENTIE